MRDRFIGAGRQTESNCVIGRGGAPVRLHWGITLKQCNEARAAEKEKGETKKTVRATLITSLVACWGVGKSESINGFRA